MEDEQKEKEDEYRTQLRRRRHRRIILLAIILFIIYIILNLIKVPDNAYKVYSSLGENYKTYTETEEITNRDCYYKKYKWSYAWEGEVIEQEGFVSPPIKIYNLENKPGEFTVYFAFFDESIHPYKRYEGKLHDNVKDSLPWNSAAMFSKKATVTLDSQSSKIMSIYTKKKRMNAVYWAYADIEAPEYWNCDIETTNITVYKNRTSDEAGDSNKGIKYITLWQLLVRWIF